MKCSFCFEKDATRACGKCELVVYCGEECATRDWIQIHASEHSNIEHDADEIIPGLWVGGLEAVRNKDFMSEIKAVVSAIPEDRFKEERLKQLLGKKRDLLRVPIEDAKDAPIEDWFKEVAAFIDEHLGKRHQVLVHCVAGHSRSVSLVLYYLMKYKGFSLDEAFSLVKEKRPTVQVNKGFWRKLRERERNSKLELPIQRK